MLFKQGKITLVLGLIGLIMIWDAASFFTGSLGAIDASRKTVTPTATPVSFPVTDGVPQDRLTRWSPGIPGGIPHWTNIHSTIAAATYAVNGTNPDGFTTAVNAAINSARAAASPTNPLVVYIEPGTYRSTGLIEFNDCRYVVLRGAGPNLTKIRADRASGAVIRLNGTLNSSWAATNGYLTAVIGDVPKGATQITVNNATNIQVGDIIMIDQLDDPAYVYFFDGYYFKRGWDKAGGWGTYGPLSPNGYRSVNELLEVVGKNGNILTVSAGRQADGTPEPWGTHMGFNSALMPEVWVVHTTRGSQFNTSAWLGIEGMYITGGVNRAISFQTTSYSWVKDVEIDGNVWTTGITEPPGGYTYYATYSDGENYFRTPNRGGNETALYLDRTFRCEIRRVYAHHTERIRQGGSSYGIVIANGSNNLIWDSIITYFDKCITGRTPGGGNVIAYNYVDNAFTSQRGWQEGAIDPSHNGFGHMDLVEGNWTAEMGVESTHGNAGWFTFLRNYANGGNSGPTPCDLLNPPPEIPARTGTVFGNQPANMTGNTHAFQATAWTREMTVIGNVLNQTIVRLGQAPIYEKTSSTPYYPTPVYRLGDCLWSAETWDTTHGFCPPRNLLSPRTLPDDVVCPGERQGNVCYPCSGRRLSAIEGFAACFDEPYMVQPTFSTRAKDLIYRHGNWDNVSGAVVWEASNPKRTIPVSYFLSAPPPFFAGYAWPWIEPTAATPGERVKTLPAKERYDAGTPNG